MLNVAIFSLQVFFCLTGIIGVAILFGQIYAWHKMKPLRDLLEEEESKNKER